MRTVLLLVLAAVVAMIALPAVSADATAAQGSFARCYTIQKSGRYNQVVAGARVTETKGDLRVHGFVAVNKACQKTNSIPIHRVTILNARLRNMRTGKVVALSGSHTAYKKGVAKSTTAARYAHCHIGYVASIKISYGYTDGSYVHPFWVHGAKFVRC